MRQFPTEREIMKKKGCIRRTIITALACACILLGVSSVSAAGFPYDRRGMIAEGEWLLGAGTTKASNRAWHKIGGVCYDGSGNVIEGAFLRGIDVSEWNDTIDWEKVVKSDVDFAFIRISDGTWHMDETYYYNMKQANAAGLPVGTYIYSRADTREKALEEAQFAISKMRGYRISYPVVFDMESVQMGALPSREISQLAVTFCEEIRKAGYYPMVYFNLNWHDTKVDLSQLKNYDKWLAMYSDRYPAPSHEQYTYTIWQATSGNDGLNPTKGLIDGIPVNNNVDINFGFKDYTKVITPRTIPLASYVPSDPKTLKDGWVSSGGKEYYYMNGKKARGWQEINGSTYCFDQDTGELYKSRLIKEGNRTSYVGSDGARYENSWLQYTAKKKYYFDGTGAAVKGWQEIDGDHYRFHLTTGVMLTNRMFKNSKGSIQYVGEDGKRYEKKWLIYEGQTYRFNAYGEAMKGGWKKIGSKYYYFDQEEGYLLKDRKIIRNGNIFYADANGYRYTGGFHTFVENGERNTYYFGANGRAYKGWHVIDGKKYYFYKGTAPTSGVRAENVTLVSGSNVVSVFDENGVCIKQYKKEEEE